MEAQTPDGQSSSVKKRSKRRNTLPDSLFGTNIIKTVDTRVSSIRQEDDELQLMKTGPNKDSDRNSDSLHNTPSEIESAYKAQHQKTLPKEW